MKSLFTLCALLLCLISISQTTITLKDYTRHEGKILDSTDYKVSILKEGRKNATEFYRSDILFIDATDSLKAKEQARASAAYVKMPKDTARINLNLPSQHFKKAGAIGIASIVMMIGGGIMSTVGGIKGSMVTAYVGAGIGGTGLVLLIPAFAKVHTGGKALEDRGW